MRIGSSFRTGLAALVAATLVSTSALAQKKYDAGATDTEIKIGNMGPYSGPNSIAASDPENDGCLLQEGQRRRRHQRPQDQFHFLR